MLSSTSLWQETTAAAWRFIVFGAAAMAFPLFVDGEPQHRIAILAGSVPILPVGLSWLGQRRRRA